MLEDNNQFQSRLDAISKAEIVLHVNGDWHELQIESTDNRLTSGALKYTQMLACSQAKHILLSVFQKMVRLSMRLFMMEQVRTMVVMVVIRLN